VVVTCERCKTQFQLDAARVPETGVLVRCSRCKHAFVVQHPAATEQEEVDHAVARAIRESETPDVTRDLPADPSSGSLFDDEETESDWEFNDDPRPGSDEPIERAGEPGPDLGAPSSVLVAPPRPAVKPAPASAPEPKKELRPEAETATETVDELGSPGDWDIFDDDEETPARNVAVPSPPPRRSAPTPLRRASDLEPQQDPPNVWVQRSTSAVGWLATAALCAVGLARGLAPQPPVVVMPAEPVAGVALEGVHGRWVDNAQLGRVLVVSGGLHNTRESFTPVPVLELAFRDASGREIGSGVPLGLPRPLSLLREGSLEQLRAFRLPQRPLGPGETRDFESVPWPLPREAADFEIRPARHAT